MTSRIRSRVLSGILCTALMVAGWPRCARAEAPAAQAPSPEAVEFFETHIRPLLADRCFKCHGEHKQSGALRLDGRSLILTGGDSGPAIVPGQPAESLLIEAIHYDPAGYQMPPDGKLSDKQIALVERWVAMGAPWPQAGDVAAAEVADFDLQARAQRWSFHPLSRPAVPSIEPGAIAEWCRNPIDRFVAAKLRESGLAPASAADRATLLRRASFDVIGLPPTVRQVEQFGSDDSSAAYEQLVDELLASPRFGERWGRHWLDLVRYAEGRGHEFDHDVANAHQYRDYVIRALNDDVSYDQFVAEHVAGDLLTDAPGSDFPARLRLRTHPRTGANESILGTGFWFLGEWIHSPVDIRGDEAERYANMIDVYSKTFLGLTVACARCHDHKFDPITAKDFYALQGYLQSSSYRQARFETMEHNRQIVADLEQLRRRATPELARAMARAIAPVADRLDDYLLGAAAVLRGREFPDGQGLKQEVLDHWVAHLQQAAARPEDPLHVWARYATGDLRTLEDLQSACRTPPEEPVAGAAEAAADLIPVCLDGADLQTDGGLFLRSTPEETQAQARCAVILSDDPAWPIDSLGGLVSVTGALNSHTTPEGTGDEPGKMNGWNRGGRVIRTRTFEIQRPRLLCRVGGSCNVRVAVGSHILINGPLHGSLLSEHPAPETQAGGLRWLSLDVSRYIGHRAHVEFVPRKGESFSLAGVLQGDEAPSGLPRDDLVAQTPLPAQDVTSLEAAAAAIAGRLRSRLGAPALVQGVISPRLDWLLQRPELFDLQSEEAARELAAAASPFIEQQRRLLGQMRRVSSTAPAMLDGSSEDESVFIRGDWNKLGDVVPRRFLEVFGGLDMPHPQEGSGRLELAARMIDPQHVPVLPRVIVNRIWQHYFGIGIVPTPDDFGYMGQDPSHPELLDWLASELVTHDWSLKHIHRLILTSAAYRMTSAVDRGASQNNRAEVRDSTPGPPRTRGASRHGERSGVQLVHSGDRGYGSDDSIDDKRSTINPDDVDPGNRLLWRQNIKRLEGEAIRDAILAISGRLDEQMGGRSIPVHLTPFLEGRGRPAASGPVDGAGRRSIYVAVRRNFPDPFFQAFDTPNPHTTTGRRNVSNVPAQALAMMNNPFVLQEAQRWGRRLLEQSATSDLRLRIRQAYLACVAREPSESELQAARLFLETQAADLQTEVSDPRVWGDLCHVLLNSKEFLFVR